MRSIKYLISLLVILSAVSACRKLPEKKDYLSPNASFSRKEVYEPVLGRTILELTQFNGDGSTYPLEFTIENVRHAVDGSPASELFQKVKVQEWKRDYTGKETSIAQIDSERIWTEKPFLQIRKGSGDFIFWAAPSSLIHTYPDSGYLFDVKVQNKGNTRVFKDFALRPLREVPYEPYEYNLYTRERKTETRLRETPNGEIYYSVPYTIHPSFLNNMYYTKDSLFTDTLVSVYFYKDIKSTSHTLSFEFLDQHLNPINPLKFNHTVWDSVVHGFNMKMTDTKVTYDVAYPVPLTELNTPYATSGQARIQFGYSRKGYGEKRIDASFGLNFAIYEPGAWTIIFYFRRDPLFEDD
jgi:hypothetical protein